MRRHVSAEALALHREGAVSHRKAGRITAHLAVCTICSDVDAGLAGVATWLAATQLAPMPAAFTERIQLAIANEAAVRAAAGTAAVAAPGAAYLGGADAGTIAAAGVSDETGAELAAGHGDREAGNIPGRADLPRRRHRRARRFRMPGWTSPQLLRGLAAAGAVVIVAGAGVLFIRGQANTTAGSAGGGTALHNDHRAEPQRPSATGKNAGTSARNGPVTLNYHLNGRIAAARALTSGRNYTRRNMVPLVHKDVTSVAVFGQGSPSRALQKAAVPGALFGGIRVFKLMGCLTGLASGRSILVADVARYLGQPATIVVMRSSANSHLLKVAVVRVTCSLANPEVIAQVTIPAG